MSDVDIKKKDTDTASNANDAPGSIDDMFGEEFFDSLEKSLEPAFFGDSDEEGGKGITSADDKGKTAEPPEEDLKKQLETLKKRYSDSSREAKRLKQELDQIKSLLPLLQSIRNEGSASEGITSFFQKGGKAQQNLKQELGLPEDFVFDPDEAINNPNSDSAKVLNALVESRVTEKLNAFKAEQERMARAIAEEQEVKKRFKLTDEQYQEIMEWAKRRPLKIEDIVFLYAKEHGLINKNMTNAAKEDILKQMKGVRRKPATAGMVSDTKPSEPIEDKLFEVIKREVDAFDNLLE